MCLQGARLWLVREDGGANVANDQHLAKLVHDGVDSWNARRSENPEVQPDLRGAHLGEAILYMANLSGAFLVQANLVRSLQPPWLDLVAIYNGRDDTSMTLIFHLGTGPLCPLAVRPVESRRHDGRLPYVWRPTKAQFS